MVEVNTVSDQDNVRKNVFMTPLVQLVCITVTDLGIAITIELELYKNILNGFYITGLCAVWFYIPWVSYSFVLLTYHCDKQRHCQNTHTYCDKIEE